MNTGINQAWFVLRLKERRQQGSGSDLTAKLPLPDLCSSEVFFDTKSLKWAISVSMGVMFWRSGAQTDDSKWLSSHTDSSYITYRHKELVSPTYQFPDALSSHFPILTKVVFVLNHCLWYCGTFRSAQTASWTAAENACMHHGKPDKQLPQAWQFCVAVQPVPASGCRSSVKAHRCRKSGKSCTGWWSFLNNLIKWFFLLIFFWISEFYVNSGHWLSRAVPIAEPSSRLIWTPVPLWASVRKY